MHSVVRNAGARKTRDFVAPAHELQNGAFTKGNAMCADDDHDEPPLTQRSKLARILVADDDSAMRDVVADTLATDGYEVRSASSGYAILEALGALPTEDHVLAGVDLMVLDHRMPGMTGLDALRAIRARNQTTPAILMTSYPDRALSAEATRLDATVLPKPFGRNDLSRVVNEKLAPRRKGSR